MSTNGKEYTVKMTAELGQGVLTFEVLVRAYSTEEAIEEAQAVFEDETGLSYDAETFEFEVV